MQNDTITVLNKRFSLDEYDKLKSIQKSHFKSELRKEVKNIKTLCHIQILDDEFLFSVVSTKANYSHMQLVNEYRDLIFKQKNTKDDKEQSNHINLEKEAIRRRLLESMFGSYSLFNRIDEQTVAINQEMLKKMSV